MVWYEVRSGIELAAAGRDEAEVVASVHNDLIDKGTIQVTLKTTIGGKSVEEKKTLTVTAKGVEELTFKASLKREAGVEPSAKRWLPSNCRALAGTSLSELEYWATGRRWKPSWRLRFVSLYELSAAHGFQKQPRAIEPLGCAAMRD